jgi:hypothetical protein
MPGKPAILIPAPHKEKSGAALVGPRRLNAIKAKAWIRPRP